MPVKLRLARHGKKSKPFYYIIAADVRAPRDGKYIERIGNYNPNTNPATIHLEFDRALLWLQRGAQPTDTVRNILSREGVIYKNHLLKGIKKGALTEEQVEEKYNSWKEAKNNKLQEQLETLRDKESSDNEKRLTAEKKVNDARAEVIARKSSVLAKEIEEQEKAQNEETESK